MLLLDEAGAEVAARLFGEADRRTTSIVAYAECRAAIAGAQRVRRLRAADAQKAIATLDEVWEAFDRQAVTEAIVRRAGDLADRRALRGFDSIHLASALALSPDVAIASWDQQLSDAARAEGLRLARPRHG